MQNAAAPAESLKDPSLLTAHAVPVRILLATSRAEPETSSSSRIHASCGSVCLKCANQPSSVDGASGLDSSCSTARPVTFTCLGREDRFIETGWNEEGRVATIRPGEKERLNNRNRASPTVFHSTQTAHSWWNKRSSGSSHHCQESLLVGNHSPIVLVNCLVRPTSRIAVKARGHKFQCKFAGRSVRGQLYCDRRESLCRHHQGIFTQLVATCLHQIRNSRYA
jgi:hypothetical protein